MSMSVTRIGRCDGCDNQAKLEDGVCDACINSIGKNLARLFKRARTDPEFAKKAFARLEPEYKEAFIEHFGNPE